MNEIKQKKHSILDIFIFINSLVIIGILAFFGYKFSKNEYSQDYYPPSDEMIEMCRVSSLCFIDDNSKYLDLLGVLFGKSDKTKYDFTLIVDSIPEPEPEPEPELNLTKKATPSPVPFEDFHVGELEVLRTYETLGDYCRDADLCLTKKNVSLKQIQSDIQAIGIGNKSIKFYMNEVEEN